MDLVLCSLNNKYHNPIYLEDLIWLNRSSSLFFRINKLEALNNQQLTLLDLWIHKYPFNSSNRFQSSNLSLEELKCLNKYLECHKCNKHLYRHLAHNSHNSLKISGNSQLFNNLVKYKIKICSNRTQYLVNQPFSSHRTI